MNHPAGCPSWQKGPAFCTCPEDPVPADPALPTYEVFIDGTRFAFTQTPAPFRDLLHTLLSPGSAQRYGHRDVAYRIRNGRRRSDPGGGR